MKIALHSVSYGGVWKGQYMLSLENLDKAAKKILNYMRNLIAEVEKKVKK